MTEKWKDVCGYEGLYQVSSTGKVRSLARHTTSGIEMKQQTDKDGYKRVCLCKENRKKLCSVHRLVADAFVPNELGLPVVNHKDEIKSNNVADNLEWCTVKANTNYGHGIEKRSQKRKVSIDQYRTDGTFVARWTSRLAIENALGCHGGNITSCCKGKRKTAHGFVWKYADK